MTPSPTVGTECKDRLDRFFARYPDRALQARTAKALRFLEALDKPLIGKPEALAAAIIYAVANQDRQACGVPGLLNSEFEAFFGVTMGSIRRRARDVAERLSV